VSTSHGTGIPIYLKCAKCKLGNNGRSANREPLCWSTLEATGRTASLHGRARNRGGSRLMGYRAEYRCPRCKHVGWSRHSDMERVLKRSGFVATMTEDRVVKYERQHAEPRQD
jgi:phage FluMu protein Com